MKMSNLKLHTPVSFTVHPDNIYGDVFKGVKIKSMVGLEDANRLGHDVEADFINVEPTLPPEAVMDISEETFLIIVWPNGNEVAIGASWIVAESIVYNNNRHAVVTIKNTGHADIPNIKAALAKYGFEISSVTVK